MRPPDRHVHVVDDDGAVRASASLLLRANGFTVEQWASGTAFLDGVARRASGCVLLDLRMPGLSGTAVLAELRRHAATLPVVVMTGHGDVAAAIRAMKDGAADFLEKPTEKAMLIAAVNGALDRAGRTRRRTGATASAIAAIATLTPRERQVLDGLVDGLSNKGIAQQLAISPRTVEIHRASVLAKLGAPSLSHALRVAFTAGLLDQRE